MSIVYHIEYLWHIGTLPYVMTYQTTDIPNIKTYGNFRSSVYTYTIDCTGNSNLIDISIPKYVNDVLEHLQHTKHVSIQYLLHIYILIHYGCTGPRQYTTTTDTTSHLSPKETTHIQSALGIIYSILGKLMS